MTEQKRAAVSERKQITLAELEPVIREVLSSGSSVCFTVTGTSMVPTVLGNRDQVELAAPGRAYRKYDLPLYQRTDGQFILHRIVSAEADGSFTCCGDHQWIKEAGIRSEQMIGLVVRICRNGKSFSVDQVGYRLWVRLWCFLLPLRRFVFFAPQLWRRILGKASV